ncbi:ead/Ea22-like family protein [Glutamicibacter sp. BW80]|uniref:ead/Ea22-like family protein n=1 Tax=Glutamicibacter sp. BW80 TaxID=2024404 RepID=UPI0015964198|nr:ead/Ea22-like family protein [Glutamicibacter sp. BW80]
MKDLSELRKTAETATPGPWHWSGNADNRQLYLATWIKGAGRCQVMDFERWGMQGAVPRFLDDDSLMMETAKDLMVYEVARNQNLPDDTPRNHPKVYRADVVDVRHPNARFMAAANPETVLALITRLEQAEENLESALEANKRWAHRSSRERSELFKAEQAVARVRELALESQAEVAQMNMPNIRTLSGEILRALDGDTRG